VDIQADLLSDPATRVVVPLLPDSRIRRRAADLNPAFEIDGKRHALMPQGIATLKRKEPGRAVASLRAEHDRILRALDILLTGV
jgi:toxin CcdB